METSTSENTILYNYFKLLERVMMQWVTSIKSLTEKERNEMLIKITAGGYDELIHHYAAAANVDPDKTKKGIIKLIN